MRLRWLPPILIWLLASGRIISLSDNRETILPPQYASHTKEENYHHFTKKEVRVWTMITSLNFCPTQSWVKNQPWFIGLMSAVALWKHFFTICRLNSLQFKVKTFFFFNQPMGFSSVLSQSRVILVLLSTFRTFSFLRKMQWFDVYLSTGFGIKSFEAMLARKCHV